MLPQKTRFIRGVPRTPMHDAIGADGIRQNTECRPITIVGSEEQQARRATAARRGRAGVRATATTRVARACLIAVGVVLAISSGLEKRAVQNLQAGQTLQTVAKHGAHDRRSDHDDQEDDQQEEVEDGVAHHSSLAELGLLQRVDGRADLTAAIMLVPSSREQRIQTYLGRSQNSMIECSLSM